MRAAVLNNGRIDIEEVALPNLAPGKARIQLMHAGLCGSDMHRINMGHDSGQGLILGHEFVGRVVDINGIQEATNISVDDVVAGCPVLPCGGCSNCSDERDNLCNEFHAIGRDNKGAFAEYVDVPIDNAHRLPNLENHKKFVLADVVAVCLHAIDDIAGDVKDKKCLIIGDGAIGATLSVVLNAKGAKSVAISSRHNENYNLISRLSAAARLEEVSGNFDFVFETVGRAQLETLELSLRRVETRGRIIMLGVFPPGFELRFDNRRLFIKEANLTSSVAYKLMYFQRALDFIDEHAEIEGLITQEYAFSDFNQGIELMSNKPPDTPVIKIIYNL